MRVFLAGATGAIGRRLLPLLVRRGHQVIATTRRPEKRDALSSAGAEPVVLDALDPKAVFEAVLAARPDAAVHQMTALASFRSFRKLDEEFALTNRLRMEGTEHLLGAALAAGARLFVAQSYTCWPNAREGGRIKTEEDPLDSHPPRGMSRTLEAIRGVESAVAGAGGIRGIVLRYGTFYGPGTGFGPGGEVIDLVRKRRLPVVGDGSAIWCFVHVDDAAEATRLAIESGDASGLFNVVDDDPAEVSVWLPELARILGAPPPYRVPACVGRAFIGAPGMHIMTGARGSSNSKAKRVLGWNPAHSSWREGFRETLLPHGTSEPFEGA